MLEVVSDKTGYPTEMLTLEMELEGDLGIDSIKRVEILSEMTKRAPGLPEVDTTVMAKLTTLGQVVDYMREELAVAGPAASATAAAASAGPPAAAAAAATTVAVTVPDVDLEALMLEVVSDKTGYPTEMLTMEMELEGDLGIDSIKRVEILSAMTDRAPGLPEVDTTVMAKLTTLGQVVEYMNEQLTAADQANGSAPAGTDRPHAPALDLRALMLEVVSEKTGYPTEMLTLEMELEGDLGIDSIKRVEILSAMTDRAPGLPEVDTTVMARLATLGQVVDYMNEQLGGGPAGTGPTDAHRDADVTVTAPSQAGVDAAAELGRFVLEAVEKPAHGLAQSGVHGQGRLLITSDGSALAVKLAEALGRRGIEAAAVEEIPEINGSAPRGLIFLGGLAKLTDVEAAVAVNRKAFEAAKKLAPTLESARPGEGLFVTVQDTGGAFGTTTFDDVRAWSAGLAALARTVAQEWPGVAVKTIDLARADRSDDELAEILAEELTTGGPDLDVGLGADGLRRVLRSKRVAVESGTPRLVDGDVVVCSGGARGVTAATMIELAGRARLRFALLGRSRLITDPECCRGVQRDAALKKALLARAMERGEKPTPAALGGEVAAITASREIHATLAAIEAVGSEARYLEVDVTDAAATTRALSDLRSQWGEVSALVHGAGVLADKRISEKTAEQFDRVFDTKISGLRSLLEATSADPLKLICMFSSVAARCGNLGQCDYAMANEILNKVAVAESRRRNGACLVRALGWGPWAGGMVSPQLEARFESMGIALIPLGEGARMFVEECSSARPEQIELVLGGRPRPEALLDPSEGRMLSVDVMVGGATHPYLRDHAIGGTPVVPVALAIEWFARTARAFRPELELTGLREVNVLRGISLHDFDRAPMRLVVQCREADGSADTDSTTLHLKLGDGNGTTYYRCSAELATQLTAPEIASRTAADLPVETFEALEEWSDGAMYDGNVLFHGPDFQMLQNIGGISDQ
ncbi:MAG: SDR family NAD(P)-dependent oxidoreductase, partial [Candidatus Binatia bacterium]